MANKIKIGNVTMHLPDDFPSLPPSSDSLSFQPDIKAQKPDTPEKLEDPVYVYRPNDPFQAGIDRARAATRLNSDSPTWVKRTFVTVFIVFPFLCFETGAFALLLGGGGGAVNRLLGFVVLNVFAMVWVSPFFVIARRARKKRV